MNTPLKKHSRLRSFLVILVSVLVIVSVVRLTEAGPLSPLVAPAPTFRTLEEIFAPLASSGYDSSGVTANKDGNALQISKCIIRKMTGQAPTVLCP